MAVAKQTLLDNVESAIDTRLTGGAIQSYSIGNRNLQYMTLSELTKLRDQLKAEIAAEQGMSTRTYVQFERPA